MTTDEQRKVEEAASRFMGGERYRDVLEQTGVDELAFLEALTRRANFVVKVFDRLIGDR